MTDLLICGDAPFSQHVGAHDGLEERHPSCVTHSCCILDTRKISLEGRKAKCDYFGREPHRNESNYGCRGKDICDCVRDSTEQLPFFTYRGEGSYDSRIRCKNCPYVATAHKGFLSKACAKFEPNGPFKEDKFYCGCWSWD